MENAIASYFRCPDQFVHYEIAKPLSTKTGYFRVGPDAICFGRYAGTVASHPFPTALRDALQDIASDPENQMCLPFDPREVAENLRCELYVADWRATLPMSLLSRVYYFVRPFLPVAVRRHLQKVHLTARGKSPFPRWPVDSSVDDMFSALLLASLRRSGREEIPFIWFWPDGAQSAAFMTHDVETTTGRDQCAALMDIDDAFGIKASFQVIPEQRYTVSSEFLELIRSRGFEVAIHDLNHDGHLYKTRKQFLERAVRINEYAEKFKAVGFRAAVLYRKQLWFDALDFEFDMSVPNVATHDPQGGGCCTVMPYFIGKIVELPVTMAQDYTLFNILGDYSIEIWKRQIATLSSKNGLMSCIVHPDYVMERRARHTYEELLAHLVATSRDQGIWITTPREVNRWWRLRANLRLVQKAGSWSLEGDGANRATIAFAREEGGKLVYRFSRPGVANLATAG